MKKYAPAILIVLLCFTSSISSIAYAGKKKTLSQQTYKILMAAQESLEKGKAAKAISTLQELLSKLQGKPYEQAIVLQSISHAHISQENFSAAIPPLKRSIDIGALPDEPQQQARFNLIRLYMAVENFPEAIDQLKAWLTQVAVPQAEAYIMLATAHLQLEHYQEAIEPLRTAIKISEAPKESWYQSLLGTYNELKQYNHCTVLLHTMLKLFPERAIYWRQLAGIQLTDEKYSEALATMELAYLRGHIKNEKELLNLAQLYLHLNAPYKAATLLESEITQNHISKTEKNWEHIANAWLLAREANKAVAALEKAKATLRNPQLGLRLAQLYIELRRWQEADKTLGAIINDGKLKAAEAGQAWILLGIARHEAKSASKARIAFEQAAKYKKTANSAKQWLAFLDQT